MVEGLNADACLSKGHLVPKRAPACHSQECLELEVHLAASNALPEAAWNPSFRGTSPLKTRKMTTSIGLELVSIAGGNFESAFDVLLNLLVHLMWYG